MSFPKRALLIGIDGVRYDTIASLETPALDRLASLGGLKPIIIPEGEITISGPMWSSIFTGLWPADHRVHDNDTAPSCRAADVFSRLVNEGHAAHPFAAGSWPPLTSKTGCGPLIDPRNVRAFTSTNVHDGMSDYERGDREVRDIAIDLLSLPSTDGAFVYFGHVDAVGHSLGVGTEYAESVEQVDAHIAQVLDALDARPDRQDWAVLVTTDHGHVDAGGHGGSSLEERSVWVLSDHENIMAWIDNVVDIAPAIERLYANALP